MKVQHRTGRSLTFISTLLLSSAIAAPAFAQIEEVIVTAQKRTEDVQTVPISITAFSSKDLAERQIVQFKDLQFATPNVSFTKTNFAGADFQIRGIGITAVGYDAESGVAVHFDDVFLAAPPLAEGLFYDLERIEVLRGPQSTLYGRGATGGSVNVISAKPVLDTFAADGEVSYGNYNAKEAKGMVNIPIITDQLGLRLAGDWLKHDGFVTNIANGDKLDSRGQYSLRGTLRWQPSERTTIDLIGSYLHENDSRMRSQKQLCSNDPTGVLGCLPDSVGTGVINLNSTLATIASSRQTLGGLGTAFGQGVGKSVAVGNGCGAPDLPTFPFYSNPACAGIVTNVTNTYHGAFTNMGLFDLAHAPIPPAPLDVLNPSDMRKVNTDFTPVYRAQDKFFSLNMKQEVSDWLDATLVAAYDQTRVFSQESYNNVAGQPIDPTTLAIAEGTFIGTLGATFGPAYAANYLPYFAVPGALPVSGIGDLGLTGGNIGAFSNVVTAFDQSNGGAKQTSVELRFNSKFEGPFNFLVAGYHLQQHLYGNYYVNANTFDYPFLILGAFLGGTNPACYPQGCIDPGYYHNDGRRNTLISNAVFGEVYYDAIPDTLKFTLGARWTQDHKHQVGRVFIFPGPVPIGFTSEDDAAAFTGGHPLEVDDVIYRKWTGRALASWTPKLDFTDTTLIYASYSRGYKAGGFNPGIQPGLGIPASYDPESIDAFELGTKNVLMDGTLQANADIWYYDYKGLQVSAIINNTSVNQNINAKLWGVEGEFVWAPTENLAFNLNLGNTTSAIGDVAKIDTRNRGAGRADVVVVKGAALGATIGTNCVLYMINGQTVTPGDNAAFQATFPSTYFSPPGGSAALAGNGVPNVNYGLCGKEIPEGFMNAFGYSYSDPTGTNKSDGVAVSLKDNKLQNTPDFTVSVGAQYSLPLENEYALTGRLDYYWQSDMYGRIFNDPSDKIKSWDVTNAKLTLTAPENQWYVQVYVKNIFDKTNMTGQYLTSDTSGLYTNAFFGDPRTFGAAVGFHL